MTIVVDIADRMYDYTDEEKAAEVVSEFQCDYNLKDDEVIAIWQNRQEPRFSELEKKIFDAVDANGSVKRAQETIPCGITLLVEEEVSS